jgi:hypothetical protein
MSDPHLPPALVQLQNEILQNIFGPTPPEDPVLLHYREGARYSYLETLEDLFSETKLAYESVEQKKTWEEISEEFLSEFWPTEIRLNRNFEKFPEWLSADPWILEVAEYEWAQYIASTSRGVRDEDWINPSVALVYFEFQIPRWAMDREEGGDLGVPEFLPSAVVVFRDVQTEQLRTLELQAAAFELLLEWIDGGSPEISAENLGQQLNKSTEEMMLLIEPLIKKLCDEGVLLQPSRKNTRYFSR